MGTVAGAVATVELLLVSETDSGSVGAGETVTCRTPGAPLGVISVPGVSAVTTVGGEATLTVALTLVLLIAAVTVALPRISPVTGKRSEEHTSELQSRQ